MTGEQVVQLSVFALLFLLVAVMGFMASRWRAAADPNHLDEWGLGGRKFGSWVTWFLLGGDLYTAYTFVAIPALLFSSGAIGFYAVPTRSSRSRWSCCRCCGSGRSRGCTDT